MVPTPDPSIATLLRTIDATLRFEYHDGAVTQMGEGHTTGWRTMPFAMSAYTPHGRGQIEFEDRTVPGAKGACCVPAGVRHKCSLLSKSGESQWSHFNFFVYGGLDLFAFVRPPLHTRGNTAERIGAINTGLAQNRDDGTLAGIARRKRLGFELLEVLLREADWNRSAARTEAAVRLAPAVEFMRAHLDDAPAMEDVAKVVHLSPSRFYALFRACFGAAPSAYFLQQRIRRAQELLLTGDGTVAEIAAQVGYASAFHFSRIFKQRCGVHPSGYREQIRQSREGRGASGA